MGDQTPHIDLRDVSFATRSAAEVRRMAEALRQQADHTRELCRWVQLLNLAAFYDSVAERREPAGFR